MTDRYRIIDGQLHRWVPAKASFWRRLFGAPDGEWVREEPDFK